MIVAILELELGILLVYCAIKCIALVPALGGKQQPGTHCTGSLLVLGIAVIGYLLNLLLGGAIAAAFAAAIAKLGGKGKGKETPTPAPKPTPAPGIEPIPGLPGGEGGGGIEIVPPEVPGGGILHPGGPAIAISYTNPGSYVFSY